MMDSIERVKMAMLSMSRYSWEQGVAAQALLELNETDGVILMAKDAVTRQIPDGRLGMMGDTQAVTDPAANGVSVMAAYRITRDPSLKQAHERMLDWLLYRAPRSETGILYHVTGHRQIWVDSFYMAPPYLAAAGHPGEALKQIEGLRDALWHPDAGLYSHIWDDDRQAYEREAFWGVGNGWAAAGMTRVLAELPGTMAAEQTRLKGYIRDVIDGCLAYLRADGLFHDLVDDSNAFVETNASQMLAYAIYRGIGAGWLGAGYLGPADAMRRAACGKVDSYGLVQGVCGAPHFDRPGTAVEGQAFFLLMEAAYRDLNHGEEGNLSC